MSEMTPAMAETPMSRHIKYVIRISWIGRTQRMWRKRKQNSSFPTSFESRLIIRPPVTCFADCGSLIICILVFLYFYHVLYFVEEDAALDAINLRFWRNDRAVSFNMWLGAMTALCATAQILSCALIVETQCFMNEIVNTSFGEDNEVSHTRNWTSLYCSDS